MLTPTKYRRSENGNSTCMTCMYYYCTNEHLFWLSPFLTRFDAFRECDIHLLMLTKAHTADSKFIYLFLTGVFLVNVTHFLSCCLKRCILLFPAEPHHQGDGRCHIHWNWNYQLRRSEGGKHTSPGKHSRN